MRKALIVLTTLSLGGCAAGGAGTTTATSVPRAPSGEAGAPGAAFRSPQMLREQGLESVIGTSAGALTQRFGAARIDLVEGDARKLQFAGQACVLDVFLYPLSTGAEPVVTHIEARLRRDGTPTDRAACLREVERQR